jgi:hypothetical protein
LNFPVLFTPWWRVATGAKRFSMITTTAAFPPPTLSEACALTSWRVHAWVLMGSGVKDLAGLKGSDLRKLALAELLWKQTTVSQEWIAEKRNVNPILSEFAP